MTWQWLFLGAMCCFWVGLGSPGQAEAAQSAPYINSPYADRPVEPTHFSPKNIEQFLPRASDEYITSINWSDWGQDEVVGTGQVIAHRDERGLGEGTDVKVILGGLQNCAGIAIYTTYRLEIAPGVSAPEGWSEGQSGAFPCLIGGDGFSRRSGHRIVSACFLGFLHRPLPDPEHFRERYPKWIPRPPGKGSTAFCWLRWTRWGGQVAVGVGLRENLTVDHPAERNWPIKLELQDPIWCPRAAQPSPFHGGGEESQRNFPALAYSVVKLTEYGPPRKPSRKTLNSYGHRGLKGRVYWQRLGNPSPAACAL